ncbi:MAG: chemotaxis protein CheW [Bacteriovoracaceae bacterium]
MSNTIFTPAWEQLPSKEKFKYLQDNLLGLVPAIVYLDDEEGALEIFQERCKELGIEAITDTDPEKLLSIINKNKARILFILSDLKMPSMSGFEFREKVLNISSDIPFIILSGFVDRETALEGIKYKISSFLAKPFKSNQLLEIIKTEGEARAKSIKDEYEMMKSFTDDVTNILEEVEEACLKLENDPHDAETVSRVFGLVHTVKGSSGFFDPKTLHLFAHTFEDLLKQIQSGTLALTSDHISVWLKAVDVIKMLNNEFITGNHRDHDIESLKSIFNIEIKQQTKNQSSHKDVEVKGENKEQKANDLKVSMQLLDEFMQTSGELTVIRNMINKVVRSIEKQHTGDKDVVALSELLDEMHKINSDVQNKITDIRRVSVGQIVKPLARNIRDTCKALSKEIDFVVEGEDLRVDNSIAEILSRSLIHLMRNSIDHGIEGNEERVKIGKTSKGKLLLKFESKGEAVFVTIQDDGKGINTDKIREKVLAQGLRNESEVRKMTEPELHMMIFEAGFSTAAQITEFSGRGVGMSMVKDSVESAGGSISVHSEKGQGSKFILEIPIPKSVLITSCLFVSSGEMSFGIPQEHIVKVFSPNNVKDVNVDKIEGGSVLRFNDRLVPIYNLSALLGAESSEDDHGFMLVLNAANKYFALKVSNVFDIEDAVIKPLNLNLLKHLSIFKGGTFMGDGRVGLILDILGIANQSNLKITKANPVDNSTTENQNVQKYVLFECETKGNFALLERDVFRVEILNQSDIQVSGGSRVVPYRESMLTLISLDEVLFNRPFEDVTDGQMSTIIVKDARGYIGLIVKSVSDLMDFETTMTPLLKKKAGLAGNTIHGNKTYTIINLDEVKNIINLGNVHQIQENVISSLDESA